MEAIFLSTFVLISQHHMGAMSRPAVEVKLQISLLAEHEITRMIKMVDQRGEKLGMDAGRDEVVEELKQDVNPEAVLDQLGRHRDRAGET